MFQLFEEFKVEKQSSRLASSRKLNHKKSHVYLRSTVISFDNKSFKVLTRFDDIQGNEKKGHVRAVSVVQNEAKLKKHSECSDSNDLVPN